MKVMGLIGGMSWESTAHYYSLLNKLVNRRLGGHESAKLLLYSVNFAEVQRMQFAGDWSGATEVMVDAALRLERGGAELLLICSNTMHISVPEIEAATPIPLLHIADATGERIAGEGIRHVGLLATAFTMERDFYTRRLREKFGLDVMIPNADHRKVIHDVIFNELVHGIVRSESKERFREIIAELVRSGAGGILLGCTELMMIIEAADSAIPIFDTTAIHCEAAVERALES